MTSSAVESSRSSNIARASKSCWNKSGPRSRCLRPARIELAINRLHARQSRRPRRLGFQLEPDLRAAARGRADRRRAAAAWLDRFALQPAQHRPGTRRPWLSRGGPAPAGSRHRAIGAAHFRSGRPRCRHKLAMKDLRATLGPARPIHMVGYSNGAALAVNYTLDARADAELPRPAGLVLISPAIGITRLAAIGRIRTGLSDLQGFGRAAWQLVEPEIDPYKYQSFSFHASGQTQRLTSGLTRRIAALAARGPVPDMPPILAFISTVDSTVQAPAVIDSLLGRLTPEGHELVVFDVNRLAVVQPLLINDPAPLTRRLAGADAAAFCADADHQCQRADAAGAGAAFACCRRRDDRTCARPGLAAPRVLAVACRVAVSARRSALRLRGGGDDASRATRAARDPRRERRAERAQLDAHPATQQPVPRLHARAHREAS